MSMRIITQQHCLPQLCSTFTYERICFMTTQVVFILDVLRSGKNEVYRAIRELAGIRRDREH